MANFTLKDVVRVDGSRILTIVQAEEEKHGPGAIVVTIKDDKLNIIHTRRATYAGTREIYALIGKAHDDGDFVILFRGAGPQEIGVVSKKDTSKILDVN